MTLITGAEETPLFPASTEHVEPEAEAGKSLCTSYCRGPGALTMGAAGLPHR